MICVAFFSKFCQISTLYLLHLLSFRTQAQMHVVIYSHVVFVVFYFQFSISKRFEIIALYPNF